MMYDVINDNHMIIILNMKRYDIRYMIDDIIYTFMINDIYDLYDI